MLSIARTVGIGAVWQILPFCVSVYFYRDYTQAPWVALGLFVFVPLCAGVIHRSWQVGLAALSAALAAVCLAVGYVWLAMSSITPG